MSADKDSCILNLFEAISDYQEWIFDLDNTIYRQEEYDACVFGALEGWLLSSGKDCRGVALKLLSEKRALGSSYPYLFDEVLGAYGLSDCEIRASIEYYRNARPPFTSRNNLVEAIECRLNGRSFYVVTNGIPDLQRYKVESLGVDRIANEVIYCDKYNPDQLKPSPWAWSQLIDSYSFINPVYVGDSPLIDGGFARNAGIDYYLFEYPL